MQHATSIVRRIASCTPQVTEAEIPPGERASKGAARRVLQASAGGAPPTMLDIIFIATTVVFFAVAWAYVHGCDSLLENRQP